MDKTVERYNKLILADRITVRAAYDYITDQRKGGRTPISAIKKLQKLGYEDRLVEIAATLWSKCLAPWVGKIE